MLCVYESSGILWSAISAILGTNLSSALTTMADDSILDCGPGLDKSSHHLKLGQACLAVKNIDSSVSLQLWAQAVECYKCPPWPYLSLGPGSSQNLAVNTTYPTTLYVRHDTQDAHTDLYQMTYHFGEYGRYYLGIGAENSTSVEMVSLPTKEYLPLIIAVIFYFMLAFMWQCAKLLRGRMAVPPRRPATSTRTETDESSPLLSASRPGSQQSLGAGEPHLSTSSSSVSPPLSPLPDAEESAIVQPPASPPRQAPIPDTRREGGRLRSLDAFRGLAIVLMIFVNYGGGKYFFFAHARWNGLTVADLVFPWFLWIMGTSMVFSVRSQLRRATKRHHMVLKIFKRCIYLFALGLIVNSTNGHNYMPDFRILGVLQRFAICYFLTAIVEVYCMNPQESPEYVWYWNVRDLVRSCAQWVFTIVLVAIQIIISFGMSVPGCPRGYLGPGGLYDGGHYSNCTGGAAGYIDRVVLGSSHVYSHPSSAVIYNSDTPYDPEGLLGALTSVLMVQFGAACGRTILTFPSHKGRIMRWGIWATITGLLAGILCNWRKETGFIPVNKNLWSLSFVLCTTCFAFFLFTFMYVIIDQKKWWSGNPLRYAGMNSILLYVGHEICRALFPWSWKPVGNYHGNYLIMNLWGMSIWIIIAYICHRKKLYFSV